MLRNTGLRGNEVLYGIACCAGHAFEFLRVQVLRLSYLPAQFLYLHFAHIHGIIVHDYVQCQCSLRFLQDTASGTIAYHSVCYHHGVGSVKLNAVLAVQVGGCAGSLAFHLYKTHAYGFIVFVNDASLQANFGGV